MNFHPEHLPAKTQEVFFALAKEKFMNRYNLIGGTALAIQIMHRQSEDLDFVFDGNKIERSKIMRFIAGISPDYRLIREDAGYQLDFLVRDVKITFFSSGAVLIPFKVREHTSQYENLAITDVPTIAGLKMAAISQRCTMRDYYDLYYIAKYILPLDEIFVITKNLFPQLSPIIYTETIIYTRDIPEDSISQHLLPAEMVTKEEIAVFFTEEIRRLKP